MLLSSIITLLGGITVATALAKPQDLSQSGLETCSVSAVTVTTTEIVTPSPITETVTAEASTIVIEIVNPGAAASSVISALTHSASPVSPASSDLTTTSIKYNSLTETFTVVPANSTGLAPLTSVVDNGTTSLVYGFTPTSTYTMVFGTSTMTIAPTGRPGSTTTITSTSTHIVGTTVVPVTVHVTETMHMNSSSAALPTTAINASSGNSGSNSSATVAAANETCSSIEEATTVTVRTSRTVTTTHKHTSSAIVPSSAFNSTANAICATQSLVTGAYMKRSVCQLVTATLNGQTIVFPNAWDGHSYVPTCSTPSTLETSIVASSTPTSTMVPPTSNLISPITPTPYIVPSTSSHSVPSSALSVLSSLVNRLNSTITSYSTSTTVVSFSSVPNDTTAVTTTTSSSATSTSIVSVSSVSGVTIAVTSPLFPNTTAIATPTMAANFSTPVAPVMASPTCGETGTFLITFDDLPMSDTQTLFPPIFAPYNHLYWAGGWSYVPPPNDPFAPQAGTRLGVFIPNNDTDQEVIPGAWFGDGERKSESAYWFNINNAYIGCYNGPFETAPLNNGKLNCEVTATGYAYDPTNAELGESIAIEQMFEIPPCEVETNCALTPVPFSSSFYSLSSLSLQASVGGTTVALFIDSIMTTWTNNTCAAGQQRAASR